MNAPVLQFALNRGTQIPSRFKGYRFTEFDVVFLYKKNYRYQTISLVFFLLF